MRNTLQYLYTILVFSGALTTSYLMVSQNELRNQTRTAQTIPAKSEFRREAAFDSAVNKLFEVESALSQFPDSEPGVRAPALDVLSKGQRSLPGVQPPRRARGGRSVGERNHMEEASIEDIAPFH